MLLGKLQPTLAAGVHPHDFVAELYGSGVLGPDDTLCTTTLGGQPQGGGTFREQQHRERGGATQLEPTWAALGLPCCRRQGGGRGSAGAARPRSEQHQLDARRRLWGSPEGRRGTCCMRSRCLSRGGGLGGSAACAAAATHALPAACGIGSTSACGCPACATHPSLKCPHPPTDSCTTGARGGRGTTTTPACSSS